MMKTIEQGADAWRNEKLCGKAFSFGPDFVLPDRGRLELDFVEMTDGDGEPVCTLIFQMRDCS
jgi:hypothetical protein